MLEPAEHTLKPASDSTTGSESFVGTVEGSDNVKVEAERGESTENEVGSSSSGTGVDKTDRFGRKEAAAADLTRLASDKTAAAATDPHPIRESELVNSASSSAPSTPHPFRKRPFFGSMDRTLSENIEEPFGPPFLNEAREQAATEPKRSRYLSAREDPDTPSDLASKRLASSISEDEFSPSPFYSPFRPPRWEPSKPLIPLFLKRMPYINWSLRRAEIETIRVKIIDAHSVTPKEVMQYAEYLEQGAIQYWDAYDTWAAHNSRRFLRRGTRATSKRERHVIATRLKEILAELELKVKKKVKKRKSTSDEMQLLVLLKKLEKDNFYPELPASVEAPSKVEQLERRWGSNAFERPAKVMSSLASRTAEDENGWAREEIEEDEKQKEEEEEVEEQEEHEAITAVEGSAVASVESGLRPFTTQEWPLEYTRRVEGIIEPDKSPVVLEEVESPTEQYPIPQLDHSLERVLFNPGVHWLQDPRSRVFNYPPHLRDIPAVTDFAFERVEPFMRPSTDPDIPALMQKYDKKFSGSTSSLSGILCHLYFLISENKNVNISALSSDFNNANTRFTAGQRMPASVTFRWRKDNTEKEAGRYYLDNSGSGEPDKNILTWMGTMLEKLLTLPKEQFAGYMRSDTDAPLPEKSDKREAFRFSKTNNFIMRSQLDCHDPRLPGSGVFDIKTRACMPIRLDIFNFEENSGYLIRTQHGKYESFEREYFDLVRSAFLKYQFQVRIGGMDGVIVAYHNTKRMFGFQYISLDEMDDRLFGPVPGIGDRVFKACLGMLEHVAEEIVACFPDQDVKATFETLEGRGGMNIWVEPVKPDDEMDVDTKAPMKLLQVRIKNYLDSSAPVDAKTVFKSASNQWSLRWSIAQLNLDSEQARKHYMAARRRQLRAWAMPTGVDPDDIQEWYENLNFSGSEKRGDGSTFRPERFSSRRDPVVEMLRQMAREGRRDTERMLEEEMGKPLHVLE